MNNQKILITGATGSFGKKMIDRIIKNYRFKRLVIFSRDELKQSLIREKYSKEKYKNLRFFIGDIRDQERVKAAFNDIDIVIHAAALKQVTTAEYNPMECIKTNIIGAENVIKAALANNVKKVVALSTDKAVDPVNLYGATKLAAEKLFISANNIFGNKPTRFSVVRYGNVIGSRGSVVEVFNKILATNKPFPITEKNMTRFWMTIDESVNLVLRSLKLMNGGETYIPKIPSIKILDLAKSFDPNKKIKIIGIRPGEKINEFLCSSSTAHLTLEFKDHLLIMPSFIGNIKKSTYISNKEGEKGKLVSPEFTYSSDKNNFLSVKEIKKHLII
tara:strand:- start:1040 stop:2032 length:993 start_codon:yes stop_codon:yes gene_type:complete